jgi:hypothetical protein
MTIYDKIVESIYEPRNTNVIWLRPVKGGFSFYRYQNGKWEILRLMNDHGTLNPIDDTPIDVSGGGEQPGPDSVGTDQIIDNSILMDDLNSSVRDKIQKTYYQNDESLHMDYEEANANNSGSGEFNDPVTIEEEGD